MLARCRRAVAPPISSQPQTRCRLFLVTSIHSHAPNPLYPHSCPTPTGTLLNAPDGEQYIASATHCLAVDDSFHTSLYWGALFAYEPPCGERNYTNVKYDLLQVGRWGGWACAGGSGDGWVGGHARGGGGRGGWGRWVSGRERKKDGRLGSWLFGWVVKGRFCSGKVLYGNTGISCKCAAGAWQCVFVAGRR